LVVGVVFSFVWCLPRKGGTLPPVSLPEVFPLLFCHVWQIFLGVGRGRPTPRRVYILPPPSPIPAEALPSFFLAFALCFGHSLGHRASDKALLPGVFVGSSGDFYFWAGCCCYRRFPDGVWRGFSVCGASQGEASNARASATFCGCSVRGCFFCGSGVCLRWGDAVGNVCGGVGFRALA
jgi:hypothetical protein